MDEEVKAALEELAHRLELIEGNRRDARADADSRHEFEFGLRDDVRGLTASVATLGVNVTSHLKKQDEVAAAMATQAKIDAELAAKKAKDEADAREQLKLEEYKRESMAAKRVGERREFWIKMVTVVAPIVIAAITALGIGYQTVANQRAHDDAASQLREFRRALTPAPEPSAPAGPLRTLP